MTRTREGWTQRDDLCHKKEIILGLAILTLIFMATLGGATLGASESQINSITNTTVKDAVKAAAVAGFDGFTALENFLPIFVLTGLVGVAIMISIGSFSGYGGGSGEANVTRTREGWTPIEEQRDALCHKEDTTNVWFQCSCLFFALSVVAFATVGYWGYIRYAQEIIFVMSVTLTLAWCVVGHIGVARRDREREAHINASRPNTYISQGRYK